MFAAVSQLEYFLVRQSSTEEKADMAALLKLSGSRPVQAWQTLIDTVRTSGVKRSGLTEMTNLTVLVQDARPLLPPELKEYRRIAGAAAWERIRHIYERGLSLSWKPSYISRLVEWHSENRTIDQLQQVSRRAARTPGAKTLCCTVLDPRDLNRFVTASIPCLVALDFKIRDGSLSVAAFFRSQDVFRFFLGDYHYLCLIAGEITASVSAAKHDAALGEVVLHLCSAHFHNSHLRLFPR